MTNGERHCNQCKGNCPKSRSTQLCVIKMVPYVQLLLLFLSKHVKLLSQYLRITSTYSKTVLTWMDEFLLIEPRSKKDPISSTTSKIRYEIYSSRFAWLIHSIFYCCRPVHHNGLSVSDLELMSNVREVSDSVIIQSEDYLRNLNFLRNLQEIHGRKLFEYKTLS